MTRPNTIAGAADHDGMMIWMNPLPWSECSKTWNIEPSLFSFRPTPSDTTTFPFYQFQWTCFDDSKDKCCQSIVQAMEKNIFLNTTNDGDTTTVQKESLWKECWDQLTEIPYVDELHQDDNDNDNDEDYDKKRK